MSAHTKKATDAQIKLDGEKILFRTSSASPLSLLLLPPSKARSLLIPFTITHNYQNQCYPDQNSDYLLHHHHCHDDDCKGAGSPILSGQPHQGEGQAQIGPPGQNLGDMVVMIVSRLLS